MFSLDSIWYQMAETRFVADRKRKIFNGEKKIRSTICSHEWIIWFPQKDPPQFVDGPRPIADDSTRCCGFRCHGISKISIPTRWKFESNSNLLRRNRPDKKKNQPNTEFVENRVRPRKHFWSCRWIRLIIDVMTRVLSISSYYSMEKKATGP